MRPTFKSLNQLTHLYTKGKQFMLGFEEYIGELHITQDKPYTGPVHTPDSKLLKPYSESVSTLIYDTLRPANEKIKKYVQPYDVKITPKKANYDQGFFIRYFVKRINDFDSFIYEVGESQGKLYGKPGGIDSNMYQLVQMTWYITTDSKLKSKVQLNNTKELTKANTSMPGIIDNITSVFEFSYEII